METKMALLKSWTAFNYYLLIALYLTLNCFILCACQDSRYLYEITNDRIKSYTFVLTEGTVQPDNYKQSGYLINGQFPGPPIFAHQFDCIKITVVNKMPVRTTIHFHGILQEHTVAADGVGYVTQDPILPNQTYVYQIQIGTQTGTYIYHGHMDYDIVFIHGAVIVLDNPALWHALGLDYQYDIGYEHYYLLEETYHYSLAQMFVDITVLGKGKAPIASVPINGRSYGQWSSNNGNAPGYEVLKVVPKKTYRIRVINVASDSLFYFHIEGHRLKVIEMDGILTFPVWTDHLEINPGQRYSVLVTMDKPIKNYWVRSQIIRTSGGPDNGRAIISYIGSEFDPGLWQKEVFTGKSQSLEATTWILPLLMPNRMLAQTEVYELPKKSNRRILIDWHMVRIDGKFHFLVNGHQYENPKTTYLTQIRQGIDISKNSRQVFEIIEGQVVDIVFQNRVMDGGICIQHPIHVHGHSFWLIAEGPDTVDYSKMETIIAKNVAGGRLQFRDVFTIFPHQSIENTNTTSGAGCGWAVIRFLANNPGVWLGHCHITTHMIMGKMFVLYEHSADNPRLINE